MSVGLGDPALPDKKGSGLRARSREAEELGIISSFDMLGAAGIEHPEAVTRGIAQALITTASGLGIAILTVFPYNYFNARIERAALSIEKYATSLEIVYEKLTFPETDPKGDLI